MRSRLAGSAQQRAMGRPGTGAGNAAPMKGMQQQQQHRPFPQPSVQSAHLFAGGQQQQMMQQQQPRMGGGAYGQTQAQMYAAQQQQQQMQQPYPGAPTVSTQVGTANRMTYQQAIHLITIRLGLVEQQLLDSRNRPSMLDPSENDHLAMIEKSVLDAMQSRIDSVDAQLKTLASAPASSAPAAANGVGAALSKQQLETLQRQLAVVQQAVTQQKTTLTQLTDENSKLRTQVATLVADVEPIKEWILNMNSPDMMGMPDMGDGSEMMMGMENGQFDIDFGNAVGGFSTDMLAAGHTAAATEAAIVVEEM